MQSENFRRRKAQKTQIFYENEDFDHGTLKKQNADLNIERLYKSAIYVIFKNEQSINTKTYGNFLENGFWTPPPPSYQFCTWILNERRS